MRVGKARGATIILISDADGQINEIADVVISTSTTHDLLTPITNSIPLQLLAYNLGIAKGTNVDRPRNLAKSVTVV